MAPLFRMVIKKLQLLIWVAGTFSAFAQTGTDRRFEKVDAFAGQFVLRKGMDFIAFTDSLTAPFTTELEKARAIFTWIGAHIDYDCGSEHRLPEEPDDAVDPIFYTRQQLENILRTRRTRCEGYSFLFKLMCNLEGIYCTQLEGFARFRGERVDPATVRPNHSWNAACLDGEWIETDVTAGAGHCEGRRFRHERQDEHFRMSDALLNEKYIRIEDGRRLINQGRIQLRM